MISVTKADYVKGYNIKIEFNDGLSGNIDLHDVVFNDHRKIFKELQNIKKFKDFKLDWDTIVWSNGLDLAPEYLHEKVKQQH